MIDLSQIVHHGKKSKGLNDLLKAKLKESGNTMKRLLGIIGEDVAFLVQLPSGEGIGNRQRATVGFSHEKTKIQKIKDGFLMRIK
jgi:hypothetical protein